VSECDREGLIMRPWPTRGCCTMEKKIEGLHYYIVNVIRYANNNWAVSAVICSPSYVM
jgi:hypothetical protein